MRHTFIVRGSLVSERDLVAAMSAAGTCVCGHSRHRHQPGGPCRHAGCRCAAYVPRPK